MNAEDMEEKKNGHFMYALTMRDENDREKIVFVIANSQMKAVRFAKDSIGEGWTCVNTDILLAR